MSEPSIDELARAMEVAHIETSLLERQLRQLDPRTNYAGLTGVEVDRGRYANDGEGGVRYLHDLLTGRRDWLLGRYEEMTARAAWRAEARERRMAGVSRFLEKGRFDLEKLTAPEWERQRAVWEAAGTVGLSAGGAAEHEAILAELRGDPPTR